MGYIAYLNGEKFFDTSVRSPNYDLIDPRVTLELGKAGSFNFTLPEDNLFYSRAWDRLSSYVDVYDTANPYVPIFAGRVYSRQMNFNKTLSISCEGLLSILNDTIVRPDTVSGNLYALSNSLRLAHNDQTGLFDDTRRQIAGFSHYLPGTVSITRTYDEYMTTLERMKELSDAADKKMRMIKNTSGNLYLDFLSEENFTENKQGITLGRNLLDIQQYIDSKDHYTRLFPLGKKDTTTGQRLTIRSVNESVDFIQFIDSGPDQLGAERYCATKIYDSITDAQELMDTATRDMNNDRSKGRIIKVRVIDLLKDGVRNVGFRMGEKTQLFTRGRFPDIEGQWFYISKQELHLLRPDLNKLELECRIMNT